MAGVPVSGVQAGVAVPAQPLCGPVTTSARSALPRFSARLVLSWEVKGEALPLPPHSTMRSAGSEAPGVTAVAAKAGGAEPYDAGKPSIRSSVPAAVPVWSATVPAPDVLTI